MVLVVFTGDLEYFVVCGSLGVFVVSGVVCDFCNLRVV